MFRRVEVPAPHPVPESQDPTHIPSLPPDTYAATIASAPTPSVATAAATAAFAGTGSLSLDNGNISVGRRVNFHPELLESLAPVKESLLVVADSRGFLHLFMDGWYKLGSWYAGIPCEVQAVYEKPMPTYDPNVEEPPPATLYLHASILPPMGPATNLAAGALRLPLLHSSQARSIAKTSTSIRILLLYTVKQVKEMRDSWLGTPEREGARGLGEKWMRHLSGMQSAHGDGQ